MADFQPILKQTPPTSRTRSSAPVHIRSQSTPYFQHTREFISDDFLSQSKTSIVRKPVSVPVTSTHISATPPRPNPARLQKHSRSLTANAISRPPLITTNIKIESAPAVVPSSVFSQSSPIKFDLSPPQSPILAPEKDRWSFIPTFKAERRPARSPSPLRMAGWFSGESAPINLGVPASPVKDTPPVSPSDSIAEETRSVMDSPLLSRPASVFSSFFSNKVSSMMSVPQAALNDEFFNLDIKEALQPHNQANPFSPSSFKNLQQSAEGLLTRMQLAYRQRVLAIISLKSGRETQDEELDEARTRTEHLKTQLNSVTMCLDEQNQEIQRLTQQLREERRLRKEDAERHRTIRIVDKDQSMDRRMRSRASMNSVISTPSMLSDAASMSDDHSDPFKSEHSSVISSPFTPRVEDWPAHFHQPVSGLHKEPVQLVSTPTDIDSAIHQQNVELKSRVGYLEKELDSCLEILQGFGL